MATLYERLSFLCEQRGIKGARMCTELGFSKSLMTDLKMGRKTGVSAVTAQKIASYFGVSVGYLLGEEDKKIEPTAQDDRLSAKKRQLIEFFETVPEDKVDLLLKVMKSIVEDD